MTSTSAELSWAIAASMLGTLACGSQASESYAGEPLLRMSGSVSVNALSVAADAVPALCFSQTVWDRPWRIDLLPQPIRGDYANSGHGLTSSVSNIVDVETRGRFPAEFDVELYVPPPPAALTPLAPGEPPSALARVCAVATEHPAVAQEIMTMGANGLNTRPPYDSVQSALRMTRDGQRYYSKRIACASKDNCEETTSGDASLIPEAGGYERVYSASNQVMVMYLSEPAPAGSYTAYRALAPQGLSAGYHVLGTVTDFAPGAPVEGCQGGSYDIALAETNALYGTSYDGLPTYSDPESTAWDGMNVGIPLDKLAPPDVIATFERIIARVEMERCPLDSFVIQPSTNVGLTIDLQVKDPWEHFLPPQPPPPFEN